MSSHLLGWGSSLATHEWCILDLSASNLGSTAAQQRGCGVERGQLVAMWPHRVNHWLQLPQYHQEDLGLVSRSMLSRSRYPHPLWSPSLAFTPSAPTIHYWPQVPFPLESGPLSPHLHSQKCLNTNPVTIPIRLPKTHLLPMQTCCPLGSSSDP